MALFHSHSLCQIFSPLLLLIFIITIHPSYGDEDHEEPMPLLGQDLKFLICNHTSVNKFCVDNLISQTADSDLRSAEGRADEARSFIASLLQTSSAAAQKFRRLLQRCQLLNNKAIEYLISAGNNLNSDSINSMVEDLNDAANVTKSCQHIIQGTQFSVLADKNSDVIKFCEISVVATNFFTEIDFT